MTEPEFRDHVVTGLAVLKTQMGELLGNGNPGRIASVERKVRLHDRLLWMAGGAITVINFLPVLWTLLGAKK